MKTRLRKTDPPSAALPLSSRAFMLRFELIEDLAALNRWRGAWDELAVELGQPFCSPAWMLAWWRHAAPNKARLRVIAVHEAGELVAIAPFYVQFGRGRLASYRVLASRISARTEPLAKRGIEPAAATAIACGLAEADPPPDAVVLEGIPVGSLWPGLLAQEWPGRRSPWRHRDMSMPAPTIVLSAGGYDEWLQTRPSRWRREVRRRRRRLEEKGAVFRVATAHADVQRDLGTFAALHYSRWGWRGGSNALNPDVERVLADCAAELDGTDRFRLWTIEVDGRVISSQIFLAAGGELAYWLGGFDEDWAALGPSTQAVLAATQHAWELGSVRIDFGAGGQEYKFDLATDQDVLEWTTLVPRGSRFVAARVRLLPSQLRRYFLTALSQSLSPDAKNRLKRLLRRAPRIRRRTP